MAMGGSAHTIFKGLYLKKSLSANNLQKSSIPWKTSAEYMPWVIYPLKNVILCLFYASEQANT